MTAELERLKDSTGKWRRWGPYLSERQWGTVREDYSKDGSAWEYLPHDHARSKAYRWGEDGIAGWSDHKQRICLSLALWNGHDPIIKERLFGLTGHEGNHGEDVKELYYYLDGTPTHSYMKMLYKYPQRPFPYNQLVSENRQRGRGAPEYEILDTGVFDDDRYFDVFVEYAKGSAEDILIRVTVHNRGPEKAPFHGLMQIWFRNTWSSGKDKERPWLRQSAPGKLDAYHAGLGSLRFRCSEKAELLFCDNDTNVLRHGGKKSEVSFYKDGFNEYLLHGNRGAINLGGRGTKAAAYQNDNIEAGFTFVFKFRFGSGLRENWQEDFDAVFEKRVKEAEEYYCGLQSNVPDPDLKNIQRQAIAGMLWSKQFYYYDIPEWLNCCPENPEKKPERNHARNRDWVHIQNEELISMPDKWEYPWYASWDLAFHCIPLALIDPEFAKNQLILITREWYMHPNGQLPAYEWSFSDVNPPVHAWAAWRVFQIDRNAHGGKEDITFLERVFHKLLLNFTWWVNRTDVHGLNVFQGGFLGLDNISLFNRSQALPTGGFISQADGTSWMAMYCLNMLRIALELALHNRAYEDIASKFFEHFLLIAAATGNMGDRGIGLWDETDEFYYDILNLPDGREIPLKVRSMVGLVPLFAVETLEPELLARLPEFSGRLNWFLDHRPELAKLVSRWYEPGRGERRLLSLLRGHRMKCLLRRMLDPSEFLSDHGVRALSKQYQEHPYDFDCEGTRLSINYEPAESTTGLFGGNSNWRGPVWFPVNFLLIESLQKFHHYYGDDFKIECPTGSKNLITINQVAEELTNRMVNIFTCDREGKRTVNGTRKRLNRDPNFRDYILFHEYFNGDTGAGLGAGHQTGWTGLVAKLIQPRKPARACGKED